MEIEEIKEKLKSGQIEFEYLDHRKIINSCKEIDYEQVGNKNGILLEIKEMIQNMEL